MAGAVAINIALAAAGHPIAVGDLMIALVAAGHQNNFGGDSAISADDPAWTLLGTVSIDQGNGAGIQFSAFWKLADAADVASANTGGALLYSFSWVDPTDSAYTGYIHLRTGNDQVTPIADFSVRAAPWTQVGASDQSLDTDPVTIPDTPGNNPAALICAFYISEGNIVAPIEFSAGPPPMDVVRGAGAIQAAGAVVPVCGPMVADQQTGTPGATTRTGLMTDDTSENDGIAVAIVVNPLCE